MMPEYAAKVRMTASEFLGEGCQPDLVARLCSAIDPDQGTDMYRIPIVKVKLIRDTSQSSPLKIVNNPAVAAEVIRNYIDGADREHLVVLLLDKQNKMVGLHTVSVGTVDQTLAAPREIFKAAILANAVGIIMAHNHPSDNMEPSVEDRARVREVAEAGSIMGIKLMDALIVSAEGGKFFSFKQQAPYDLV